MNLLKKLFKNQLNKLLESNYIKNFLQKYNYDKKETFLNFFKKESLNYSLINNKLFYEYFYPKNQFDFASSIKNDFTYLQHRTSLERALNIIYDKSMFGCDYNQGTHFETPLGSGNCADAKGVTMYFKWIGTQEIVNCNHDYRKAKENILYHVSFSEYIFYPENISYWESRIYPGCNKGLYFIGMKFPNSEKILILDDFLPINIKRCDKQIRDQFNSY